MLVQRGMEIGALARTQAGLLVQVNAGAIRAVLESELNSTAYLANGIESYIGAKQGQILQAEGRREAAFRDAEARERSAEAEARATQMVSDAIAKGDVAALNYFIADKYIKAFGQIADSPNQKIIMLPIEAMNVLGSLAGIGEIAKATFGESATSAQAATRRGSVPTTGAAPTPPSTPRA